MTRRFQVMCATLLVAAGSSFAIASTPSLMNYQGILTNPSGDPQVGTFDVTFSVYDEEIPSPNPALWSEIQTVTTDSQGRFNVLLGTVSPIGQGVFTGPDRWLATRVSPDLSDLAPRVRFASVPYAFRSSTIDRSSGTLDMDLMVSCPDGPKDDDQAISLVLSADTQVLLTFAGRYESVSGAPFNTALNAVFNIDDGSQLIGTGATHFATEDGGSSPVSATVLTPVLPSGTHTFRMRGSISNSGNCGGGRLVGRLSAITMN